MIKEKAWALWNPDKKDKTKGFIVPTYREARWNRLKTGKLFSHKIYRVLIQSIPHKKKR